MRKERNKKATILLKRDALIHDISNKAYLEGEIMPNDSENAKHQTIDIVEDGNVDIITRNLDLAYAECVEAMYPYTKTYADDNTAKDNTLVESEEYVIHLLVDDDFSATTIDLISKLVHEYMVSRALSEYLEITKPASAEKYIIKAEELKTQIRIRLNARCGRVRRTLSPF